jgi:hypothetical protein
MFQTINTTKVGLVETLETLVQSIIIQNFQYEARYQTVKLDSGPYRNCGCRGEGGLPEKYPHAGIPQVYQ